MAAGTRTTQSTGNDNTKNIELDGMSFSLLVNIFVLGKLNALLEMLVRNCMLGAID